ncbi:hypothetical protein DEDE109153_16270 [Deinococcus deserti]
MTCFIQGMSDQSLKFVIGVRLPAAWTMGDRCVT